MKSLDVEIWGVRKRATKRPSYDVRWSVAGNVFRSRSVQKRWLITIGPSFCVLRARAKSSTARRSSWGGGREADCADLVRLRAEVPGDEVAARCPEHSGRDQ